MYKINDLSESEKLLAKVNSEGIVMCPHCNNNPAIVTEYGMMRNCKKCGEIKEEYNVRVGIMEGGRMKYY